MAHKAKRLFIVKDEPITRSILSPIHYAIIRPMDFVTSFANQPGLGPEVLFDRLAQLLSCP
jgi:hypothetical protein